MTDCNVNKKDYVVVQTTKESGGLSKPQLLRVKQVNDLNLVGILQKDPHLKEVTVEAKLSEVLSNYGPKPRAGMGLT